MEINLTLPRLCDTANEGYNQSKTLSYKKIRARELIVAGTFRWSGDWEIVQSTISSQNGKRVEAKVYKKIN